MDHNILAVDIASFNPITCYNCKEIFGEDSVIKFIKNRALPPGHEFAVWTGNPMKIKAASLDILGKTFADVINPALQVLYESKVKCQLVYSTELDSYVSLYDKGDYFHVKILQGIEEIFSLNTTYDAWVHLKIICRKGSEAYICVSSKIIFLFDFASRTIKKIYRSTTNDIMVSAYNRKDDALVLIYAFDTSDTITIDDFSDFYGFDN